MNQINSENKNEATETGNSKQEPKGHTKEEVRNELLSKQAQLRDEQYRVKVKNKAANFDKAFSAAVAHQKIEYQNSRSYIAKRPEKIDSVRAVLEKNKGLTVNGKLLMVLREVQNLSIYELAHGFHGDASIDKLATKKKKLDQDKVLEKAYNNDFITKMRQQLMGFRKSIQGNYFVIRGVVNAQNQRIIKLFKTEEEYKEERIDEKIKARLEGIKAMNQHDHIILAMTPEERKTKILEQVNMQRMRLKVLSQG